jgi:RNA polymerase sigma-70 factor (ECF subfamily)
MPEQLEITPPVLAQFPAYYRSDLKPLIWFLITYGASVEEAQDIAQEAMTVALQTWPTINTPHAFVRKVAVRIFLRSRQKTKREREAARRAIPRDITTMFDTDVQYVLRILDTLPPEQREVMAWTIDGYSPSEIAEMNGHKPTTVRSHLRYARLKIIRALEQQQHETARREASDGP